MRSSAQGIWGEAVPETAIKNDIKAVSGLHNSGLIMFDTAASLSSAFKERAQIQATLCRAWAVFSYSSNPASHLG